MAQKSVIIGFIAVVLLFVGCKKTDNGDGIKPVIVVLGYNPMYWALDLPYMDSGAEAYDVSSTGDTLYITDLIETKNDVDVSKIGEYSVTYNVKDASGLAADTQVRTVKVVLGK